jgi:hypothetical protein
MTWPKFRSAATGEFVLPTDPVPWVGIVLIVLAALMLIEAVRAIVGSRTPPAMRPALATG